MIPRTFPSEFVTPNGKTQAIVYSLPSVSGLKAWIDYIPVKGVANSNTVVENTYAADGYMLVRNLDAITGMTPFKDYIPVYEDATATKPWSTDVGGYIPMYGLFSVQGLFAAGEQGAWYDPSDLTTLFQDAAGTTPVTAVEQPVGLMLDKSKGPVLGPELVTNGDFSNGTTGWTPWSVVTLSVVSGELQAVSGDPTAVGAYQVITTVAGKWYTVTSSIRKGTSVDVRMRAATSTPAGTLLAESAAVTSTTATAAVLTFQATSTATAIYARVNSTAVGQTGFFDNISVRELPGNHAYQSTSAARPVLSARVNLLTKTEQFDDAAWVKGAISVSANTTSAPDGTISADTLTENALTTNFSASQTVTTQASTVLTISASARVQSGTRYLTLSVDGDSANWLSVNFDLVSGSATQTLNSSYTLVGSPSVIAQANGFFRCSFSVQTTAVAASTLRVSLANSSTFVNNSRGRQAYTGDGTSGIYIWGADLRAANDGVGLPAYQRVNTSTDYDTAGFPPYIKPNGSSQFMVTNNIVPGTDKVQVFAGVRKLSDAAIGAISELSANSDTNAGSFYIVSSVTAGNYQAQSGGSSRVAVATSAYTAPTTNVVSNIGDISAPSVTLRVNGAQIVQSVSSQGTGNFGNYPLYLFARGGTTLWYSGRFYGMILRFGPTLTAAQISSTETWMNTKTKAY